MPSRHATRCAVVLVGHGAPATDCPPQLVGELMALEWRGDHTPPEPRSTASRMAELDAALRNWPRTPQNDPYKAGLERLAHALQPLLSADLFTVAYNEFCRPSVGEAVTQMVQQGATRVFVLPTMMTPGGLHSEQDIPRALEAVRRQHPGVSIEYLWPFRVEQVAALLAEHLRQTMERAACA